MGRITIFTTEQCRHCHRVKAALNGADVPYTEISISAYPQRRQDMIDLSGRYTVPQVFFNDEHIGGADDTLAVFDEWEGRGGVKTRYEEDVEVMFGPSDLRLQPSSGQPAAGESTAESSAEHSSGGRKSKPKRKSFRKVGMIALPDGRSRMTVAEMTSKLMKVMPRKDLSYGKRVYKDCFKGKDGVNALLQHFNLNHREEAITLGRNLQRNQLLHHVCDDKTFGDNSYFFRLHPFRNTRILNSFRIWTEPVDPDPLRLVNELKDRLYNILMTCTDDDGLVDYLAAEEHEDYILFEDAACELQGANVGSLDPNTRLAFFINLYNLMISHGFVKVGIGKTSLARGSFFRNTCYNVGGDILSFDEVEHGIIRVNSRPPYALKAPFSTSNSGPSFGDSRIRLALQDLDPRIHFALNCGAKSCPPVRTFSGELLDEELNIVSRAFCEDDDNCYIDEERHELHLSMLFSWYKSDFASSTSKLPIAVLPYLSGAKKAKLQRMMFTEKKKSIEVKFKRYNWSSNASRSKKFENHKLEANEVTMKAFFSGRTLEDKASRSLSF